MCLSLQFCQSPHACRDTGWAFSAHLPILDHEGYKNGAQLITEKTLCGSVVRTESEFGNPGLARADKMSEENDGQMWGLS